MIGTKNNLENYIAALDLGTSSVKAVIANPEDQVGQHQDSFYVSAVGSTESKGVRKGVVINVDSTVSSVSDVITQAEKLALQKVRNLVLGVSGAHLEGVNSNGVTKVQYNEVGKIDIDRVLDAAQAVPVSFDREIIHVLSQDYIVDGQQGIKDPMGITAVRLESKVHLVSGSTNCIQSMVKCVNRSGLNVDDLVLNSIASALAVTTQEERAQGVCVVDIGAGTADIAIYYDGAIQHSAVLPLGGGLITKDLAAGLRIGILSAENLKCNYGIAPAATHSGEQRIEVKSIGNQISKIINQSEIAHITKLRLSEMFEMIRAEIVKSGFKDYLTAGIVLTGGTAKLAGIVSQAEDSFALPVRIGTPQNISGLSDFVDSPEYAAAVGLIKFSLLDNQGVIMSGQSSLGRSYRKIANWFSEHF